MELDNLLNRYLTKDIDVSTFGDVDESIVNQIIFNCKQFEEPDIVSVVNDNIYAIEHFEFDSYKQLKKGKGSDFKKKQNIMNKEINAEIDEQLKSNSEASVHKAIEDTSSLNNYYDNFALNFKNHYSKLANYKKRILQNFGNKKIHFFFFAENSSPLGSYFLDENRKINILLPIYSKTIRNLLLNSQNIEYLIVGTYCMNEYKMFIIKNDPKVLSDLEEKLKNVNDENYLSFAPQTFGFASKIE